MLSVAAYRRIEELKGHEITDGYRTFDAFRCDPAVIQAVVELGEEANGGFAELKVVEIPDGIDWTIEEYDGIEWIAEVHRTWR